jgi:DNA repair protein RecO
MATKSFSTEALVLKRFNAGESDRIVTLLTPQEGKLTGVAKGVRKMTSSQGSLLEPGNYVSIHVIHTKSMPILSQTRLINDYSPIKTSLKGMKQLAEVLEIVDQLFPEGAEEEELFQQVIQVMNQLNKPQVSFQVIQDQLVEILIQLGYQNFRETSYSSILEFVSAVADRPLRSYDYLTIRK